MASGSSENVTHKNELPTSRKQVQTSKIMVNRYKELGATEVEILAQITLPPDGGWGWVVVIAAFFSLFVLNGSLQTYGSLLKDIAMDYEVSDPASAAAGSLQYTLSYMLSPVVSALINRLGFRTCAMTGSIICCYSAIASTLSHEFSSFFLLYGMFLGIGTCFIQMTASLVAGFYFEKYRSFAMTLVTAGSSIGVMVFFPINVSLVEVGGWRPTVLLQSGLLGLLYFMALTYRPLASMGVTKLDNNDNPTRTVTYLPTIEARKTQATANKTERALKAQSNIRFPTAAAMMEDDSTALSPQQTGPSKRPDSRLMLTSRDALSRAQLKEVQSKVSRAQTGDVDLVEIRVKVDEAKQPKSCWGRLCHWEKHTEQARPMYRDDAFYTEHIERLDEYKKSKMDVGGRKTGLEYQLAVTRGLTEKDLKSQRGLLTPSVRRVLATMCDVDLLKRPSFILFSISALAFHMGMIIPMVYLQDRNKVNGIEAVHCKYFVSVIGASQAVGRIFWGIVAIKLNPLYIYIGGLVVAGISTILSHVSYSLFFQYFYSLLFGLGVCAPSGMRSLVAVDLYGLERLTNTIGMQGFFIGFGCLFGTPLAGILKDSFGYNIAFIFAGAVMVFAGVIPFNLKKMVRNENKKEKEGELERLMKLKEQLKKRDAKEELKKFRREEFRIKQEQKNILKRREHWFERKRTTTYYERKKLEYEEHVRRVEERERAERMAREGKRFDRSHKNVDTKIIQLPAFDSEMLDERIKTTPQHSSSSHELYKLEKNDELHEIHGGRDVVSEDLSGVADSSKEITRVLSQTMLTTGEDLSDEEEEKGAENKSVKEEQVQPEKDIIQPSEEKYPPKEREKEKGEGKTVRYSEDVDRISLQKYQTDADISEIEIQNKNELEEKTEQYKNIREEPKYKVEETSNVKESIKAKMKENISIKGEKAETKASKTKFSVHDDQTNEKRNAEKAEARLEELRLLILELRDRIDKLREQIEQNKQRYEEDERRREIARKKKVMIEEKNNQLIEAISKKNLSIENKEQIEEIDTNKDHENNTEDSKTLQEDNKVLTEENEKGVVGQEIKNITEKEIKEIDQTTKEKPNDEEAEERKDLTKSEMKETDITKQETTDGRAEGRKGLTEEEIKGTEQVIKSQTTDGQAEERKALTAEEIKETEQVTKSQTTDGQSEERKALTEEEIKETEITKDQTTDGQAEGTIITKNEIKETKVIKDQTTEDQAEESKDLTEEEIKEKDQTIQKQLEDKNDKSEDKNHEDKDRTDKGKD